MSALQEIHVQQEERPPKAYGQPLCGPETDIAEAVLVADEEGSLRDFHVIERPREVQLIPKDSHSDINVWLLFTGILRSHQVSRNPRVERTGIGSAQVYDVFTAKANQRAGKIRADYRAEPRDIPTVSHQVRHPNNQQTPTYS